MNEIPRDHPTLKRANEFHRDWLKRCEPLAAPPGGIYAAWWGEPGDPLYSKSRTREEMARCYRGLPLVASYVLASLARTCSEEGDRGHRVPLPSLTGRVGGVALGVNTPDGPLMLDFGQEKGIRWLFPRTVSRQRREAIWRGLADMVEAGEIVTKVTGNADAPTRPISPTQWWSVASQAMEAREAAGVRFASFGTLFLHMGVKPALDVDAVTTNPNEWEFMEFPTPEMMEHHEETMKWRLEGQFMLIDAMRREGIRPPVG